AAFLDRACAGDAGLRAEVDRLLMHERTAGEAMRSDVGAGQAIARVLDDDARGIPSRSHGEAVPSEAELTQSSGGQGVVGSLGLVGAPVIDGYRITGRLGRGGMGVVWAAVQLATQRPVALKILGEDCFT